MIDKKDLSTILIMILVVMIISSFAGLGWYFGGTNGMQFAGVVTSGILTAALVGLYFQQTTLLEDQISLRTQELNQEVRQTHTETLRRRIYAWLGVEDVPQTVDSIEDIFEDTKRRLPKVTEVDVEPAESYAYSYNDPDEFRVIPAGLEDDRYFIDLLENHAPELKNKTETINQLYSEFTSHREAFKTNFNGVSLDNGDLHVEPDIYLSDWVFVRIVKIERQLAEDWDKELETVIRTFEDRAYSSKEQNELRFMSGNKSKQSIYCVTHDELSVDEISEQEACDLATEAIQETASKINVNEDPYADAAKAAETLDLLKEEIHSLKIELIEYAGRPVFPGGCKYLDEAAIEGAGGLESD